MSEERTYKIPHNFYDENGALVETRDIEFTTNTTDTTVYVQFDGLVRCHSKYPHNAHRGMGILEPARFDGKRIVFEDEKFGYVGDKVVEFHRYEMDCNGTSAMVSLYDKEGKLLLQRATPVYDHPFAHKDEEEK